MATTALTPMPLNDQPEAFSPSLARMVREEIHQVFSPPDPPTQHFPTSYAAAIRQQAPTLPTPPPPPRRQSPLPVHPWPAQEPAVPPRRQSPLPVHPWPTQEPAVRPPVRKTDLWRTADGRPLCYHCGEPGHIQRRCPYRDIGLPGFSPTAPRPRLGQRPAEIADYLAAQNATSPDSRRSRSPSPAAHFSPTRRNPRDSRPGRFSSPRREN